MELQPIKTKKIYEEIVEQVKKSLSEGKLMPGERFYSERELSEKLGVSRASVREAIRALTTMGVLEVKPGEGTFVRKVQNCDIVQPLVMALLLEEQQVMYLLEARQILEREIAYLAARRATTEDKEKLVGIIQQMGNELARGFLQEDTDVKFHLTIAGMAHNPILSRLMYTIADTIAQTLANKRNRLYSDPDNARVLFEQHSEITQAIISGAAESARRAMGKHLRFVARQLK
ncbi:Transcription regulator HTH, GntR [Moorella glycerini]|uniref:HTH-type transcriptional regulator LutR n=1 Tax=Neomoorella stamsii TaxID=1266720 RepID=A0A9X7P6I4_9FIRM|nr:MULTISPECIES: FadR/GntR family transcriptional regulator [Moorella]PRR73567.1 HTH-type transcriptional regulator LutR [Moorella stamsii]CEP69336.1 Transcription regulator HTH, GntR [Moorella glycerini]